jgi:FtsK/SpoIIIE family
VRVAVYTLWFRALAYLKSAMALRTLWNLFVACARGVSRTFFASIRFVNASSKPELLMAHPVEHQKEVIRRRYAFFGMFFLWLLSILSLTTGTGRIGRAFAAFKIPVDFQGYGWPGLLIVGLIHIGLFTWIGKTDVLMIKVQTKRMAGEAMLRRVVDTITLTTAQMKQELTSQIVSPPARLSTNRGYEVTLRVHTDGKPDKIFSDPTSVAAKLQKGARTVFVYRVKADASLVRILVLDVDPWTLPPTMNPLVSQPRPFNLWVETADLGTKPDFTLMGKRLVEEGDGGGIIAGGAPRRGKSVFVSNILVYLMLDPSANIHLVDGSGVDFAVIKDLCASYIGDADIEDIELLRRTHKLVKQIKTEANRRKGILAGENVSKLSEKLARKHGLGTEWLIIDELAVITEDLMETNKAEVMAFRADLQWLVRMGPKYGIFSVLSTQRPSEKSIPPAIKDLIVFRVAFYIASAAGSRAILDKAGVNNRADLLDPDQKGVCISVGEGQFRAHLVEVSDLAKVAAYARTIRTGYQRDGQAAPADAVWPEPVQTMIDIMVAKDVEEISTEQMIGALKDLGYDRVNDVKLAASLKPFMIGPRRVRIEGSQVRGYSLADLKRVTKVVTNAVLPFPRPVTETACDGCQDGTCDGVHDQAARTQDCTEDDL